MVRVINLLFIVMLCFQFNSWGQSYINVSDHHLLKSDIPNTKIHQVVDKAAEFPGHYLTFFTRHFRYPDEAIENGIQGKIVVTFVVEKDGSITGIKFANKLGFGIEDEVIRVFKSMPKWKPAQFNGQLVRSEFKAPINLVIE